MTVLTAANQLTLLRMLLIPAFVILVLYGHLGWALVVFVTAGVTDGLDGADRAARPGRRPASARGSIRWPTSCCWSPRSWC